jgi:hypothetical protein
VSHPESTASTVVPGQRSPAHPPIVAIPVAMPVAAPPAPVTPLTPPPHPHAWSPQAPPRWVPQQYRPPGWEQPQYRPSGWEQPQYRPSGWDRPPQLPQPPRRSVLWPLLSTLLVLSMLLAVAGATLAVVALRGDTDPGRSTAWVDAAGRDAALKALLARREDAVKTKNPTEFMADVDPADPAVVRRERQLYDNLTKIPFALFHYELLPYSAAMQRLLSQSDRDKFHQAAAVGSVQLDYRIQGIDSKTVATPWVPIFGYGSNRWRIVGEAGGNDLTFGANAQPWDAAGAITVVHSRRVVAVLSADDVARGAFLLDLAEKGLDQVARTRSGGWDGKVFVTAVQDQRIFDRYFADSPERVAQVAAIAVPYYDHVPGWPGDPVYAATRIVFNPQELSAQPEELAHDLSHEFTHAAMGRVTSGYTPRWLVEGFAEYTAYHGQDVSKAWIGRALGNLDTSKGLPDDEAFYKEPRNYVGAWLACKMIAERYGVAKLIGLYAAFQTTTTDTEAIQRVLGVGKSTLDGQWQQYIAAQRST